MQLSSIGVHGRVHGIGVGGHAAAAAVAVAAVCPADAAGAHVAAVTSACVCIYQNWGICICSSHSLQMQRSMLQFLVAQLFLLVCYETTASYKEKGGEREMEERWERDKDAVVIHMQNNRFCKHFPA